MTNTNDLIEDLVAQLRPVSRLRRPGWRAGFWLCLALGVLALLVMQHGLRPDLAEELRRASFSVSLVASLATGLLAAIASLTASLPDRSRWWLLLPVPTLLLWLCGVGYGCLTDWVEFDGELASGGEALRCFSTLLLVSLPLSALMFVLLRHAGRLRPTPVILTAGLAVAALTSVTMSLLHQLDATLMILIWNLGAALVIIVFECTFGQRAMAWFGERLAR